MTFYGWITNQIFVIWYWDLVIGNNQPLVLNVSIYGQIALCIAQTQVKVIWSLCNYCARTLHPQTCGRCFPCVHFRCYMKIDVRIGTRCNCEHWAKTPWLLLHRQLAASRSRLTSSAGGHTSNTPLMADKVVGPGPAGQQMGTFGCGERQCASQVHCWRAQASYFHWMLRGNRFQVYGKAIKRQNLDSSKTEKTKVRLM